MLGQLWQRQPVLRHYVANGRVACPVRSSDVDIEACFRCARLREIVKDPRPFVACDGARPGSPRWILESFPPHR